MSKQAGHIRQGHGSVRPYLCGPIGLLDFVQKVFGAIELERHEFGPKSFHVEFQIDDSVIVIEAGDLPPDVNSWTNSIYVYVEDVDLVYERAIALGAPSLSEPEAKPYQERQAGFIDAGGNTWWIATFTPSA